MGFEPFKNIDLQSLVTKIGKSDVAVQILGIAIYSIALFTQSEEFFGALNLNGFTWDFKSCNFHFMGEEMFHSFDNRTACEIWADFTGMTTSSLGIIIHIVQLLFAAKLIRGAEMRNDQQCHQWLLITVILTGVEMGINAGQIAFGVKNFEIIVMYSAPTLLYRLTSCGVVKSFVTEVRRLRLEQTGSHSIQPKTATFYDIGQASDDLRNPLLT